MRFGNEAKSPYYFCSSMIVTQLPNYSLDRLTLRFLYCNVIQTRIWLFRTWAAARSTWFSHKLLIKIHLLTWKNDFHLSSIFPPFCPRISHTFVCSGEKRERLVTCKATAATRNSRICRPIKRPYKEGKRSVEMALSIIIRIDDRRWWMLMSAVGAQFAGNDYR